MEVGENLSIYQQVTMGQKRNSYPKIGNNLVCYPGSKIIGGIVLGDNITIGVNSIVLSSFDSNSTLIGIPAKKARNISMEIKDE